MRIIKIALSRSDILNKFLAGGTASQTALGDNTLYDALRCLYTMDEYHVGSISAGGKGIKDAPTLNAFWGTYPAFNKATYHPYLSAIAKTFSARLPAITKLFFPFNDILGVIVSIPGAGSFALEPAYIETKARLIIEYSTGGVGGSTRTIQYPMFQELFKQFSNSVASAANKVGNAALSSAVASGGLLDYNKLFTATGGKLGKPQPSMYTISEELINDIMGSKFDKSKYTLQNVNAIKERFMYVFGIMKEDERKGLEKERQESGIVSETPDSAAPGAPRKIPIQKSYNASDQQFVNPYFLTSLLIFFMQYHKKVSALPN